MVAAVRVSRPQNVGAVACQFHLVSDLLGDGLNPVAPLGDDLPQDRGHAGALAPGGWDEHGGAPGGLGGDERFAVEALVCQQVAWRRPGQEQVFRHLALVHGRGTMLQARTMRLPRSVLIASRNPYNHSACAVSRPNRATRPFGPAQLSGPRTRAGPGARRYRSAGSHPRQAGTPAPCGTARRRPTASGSAGSPRIGAAGGGTGGSSPGPPRPGTRPRCVGPADDGPLQWSAARHGSRLCRRTVFDHCLSAAEATS